MKKLSLIFILSSILLSPTIVHADEINLQCNYIVESRGQTSGSPNLSKSLGAVSVESVLHIKTDNGDYLDKMSMSVNDSSERSFEFEHPSEFEDSYDAVGVEVTDGAIKIKRLPTLNTGSIKSKATLSISRRTGSISGNWRMTWIDEGIMGDVHSLSGKCTKYEQAF
tara:strand:- start:381 stop:881 length:501 start_codon:yes stop_codon:yes gene_type:complete